MENLTHSEVFTISTPHSAELVLYSETPEFKLESNEQQVFRAINLLRKTPSVFLKLLETYKDIVEEENREKADEKKSEAVVSTETAQLLEAIEETRAVLEASTGEMPPFTWSDGLAKCSKDMVDAGISNSEAPALEHNISVYGACTKSFAENTYVGKTKIPASKVVLDWLIGAQVPSKSHRLNMLSSSFKYCGVALVSDSTHGTYCVATFAEEYEDKGTPKKQMSPLKITLSPYRSHTGSPVAPVIGVEGSSSPKDAILTEEELDSTLLVESSTVQTIRAKAIPTVVQYEDGGKEIRRTFYESTNKVQEGTPTSAHLIDVYEKHGITDFDATHRPLPLPNKKRNVDQVAYSDPVKRQRRIIEVVEDEQSELATSAPVGYNPPRTSSSSTRRHRKKSRALRSPAASGAQRVLILDEDLEAAGYIDENNNNNNYNTSLHIPIADEPKKPEEAFTVPSFLSTLWHAVTSPFSST